MATVTETRYTPEDLLAITDRPMPELVDGQLVERPPMGQKADAVAARIIAKLVNFSEDHLPAVVNGSQGSLQIFPGNPGKVRIPDASFTRLDRLPGGEPAEGHGRVAPDLVVEVISPNDEAADVFAKIAEYFDAGVATVWVANPDTKSVFVFRPDGTMAIHKEGDFLDGGPQLPGLRITIADLFRFNQTA